MVVSQQEFERFARRITADRIARQREAAERIVRVQGGSVERVVEMLEAARVSKQARMAR